MAKKNTPAPVIVDVIALRKPVAAVVSVWEKRNNADVKFGDKVVELAKTITLDDVEPFCKMVQAGIDAKYPDKASSNKVQVSYIRSVMKAIVAGYEPEEGQSLRSIYDAIPKKKTGGASHGARTGNPAPVDDGDDDDVDSTPKMVVLTKAEKREADLTAAITVIFGTCNPELFAAVEYAEKNSGVFMTLMGQRIAADQKNALSAAIVASAKKPAKPAAKVAKPRQRKAA